MKTFRALAFAVLSVWVLGSAVAADWQIVRSPNSGGSANSLASVAAAADNDVWAVGWAFSQQLNAYRTQVQHWNGGRWSLVKSPNATNGYNLLNGVAVVAAKNVGQLVRRQSGALAHPDRTLEWGRLEYRAEPKLPGLSYVLQAVTVIRATDIWAVGYSTDSHFR